MVHCKGEHEKGVLRKHIRVQGDIEICGRWDDKADSISILCIFNVILIFLSLKNITIKDESI